MRSPWSCDPRIIEPSCIANPRFMELETAKEILAEIFHARPVDVNDMIQKRLEERSWAAEQRPCPDEDLWPATFCLEE
jgi:hypothetical protein